jgi:regulator of sirC expression with transglutaminase-like and TPR domain
MTERFPRDTAQQRTYRAFETLIAGEDTAIDLAQADLLVASIVYPDLDMAYYMAKLDGLARRVREVLAQAEPDISPPSLQEVVSPAAIEAMHHVLFEEEGFRGNLADYHNPNNSFLNKVLEEHTGIPITLSIIYMEVGRRIGIRVDGIGLPFHFLVRCRLDDGFVYIDPFHSGQLLNEHGCLQLVRRIGGNQIRMHSHWFKPVTHKMLLTRVLNNLKQVYLDKEDFIRALAICDLLILLHPQAPTERRDRGIIHLELKHYAHALYDLQGYTQLAPQSEDRYEMLNHIKTIRQIIAMMN